MPVRRIRAVPGEELRALMSRVPSGVAVVTVDTNGQRVGLTVSSLVVLSLEPPLVAITLSRQAAMHELLREADGFAVSILTEGQERLAQHFARGVPPIAMWQGIAVEAGETGAPLLSGALGWLECRLHNELQVGTHTLFVGEVVRVQLGKDAPPLQRSHGEYTSGDRSPSSSTSTTRSSSSDGIRSRPSNET
jgi:flavin reductase (DIM6/NTAB) family NADH-FMN oxidoreductase RutF